MLSNAATATIEQAEIAGVYGHSDIGQPAHQAVEDRCRG
jgi:hypothetical protein